MGTPDSSRFWPVDGYTPGRSQPSYDKQPVRDWLDASGWDREPPPPALPADVIARTAATYREAYRLLTERAVRGVRGADGGRRVTVFAFEVLVSLKDGLSDPQGKAVESALPALGWTNVSGVRVGKHIQLDVEAPDESGAMAQVEEMARRLLSNPVIEDVRVLEVEAKP